LFWILITVLVGLSVVTVQLLLMYQERASRLRFAQDPIRKQIKGYEGKIDEVGEVTRAMANESLVQLKKDLSDYQRRSGHAANLNSELDPETQAWVAERAGDEDEEKDPAFAFVSQGDDSEPEDEAETEVDIDGLLGGRKDPHHKVEDIRANPVEWVQSIRMEGDEVEQETEAEGVGA
jgi:hypothetical protein